jgi:parallel beta-helix repeat protein
MNKTTVVRLMLLGVAAPLLPLHLHAAAGTIGPFYTVPNATFIEKLSGDQVVTINDTSGSISTLQTSINNARSSNPSAVIVINLKSAATYTVSSAPLTLGSHMCLVGTGATLSASSTSTAAALVQVSSGSTNVSVAGGTYNGNGRTLIGINVLASSRVNIDKVTVLNTGSDCIVLTGNGNTVFDNESTITRSDCSGSAAHAGISLKNATQALIAENSCHNNAFGIYVSGSARSTIFNNTCNSDTTAGIQINSGNDNTVSNNHVESDGTGLALTTSSTNNVIASNYLKTLTTGISSSGTGDTFYDNFYSSGVTTRFVSGGTGNNVVAYKGTLSASGQNYFYPPTTVDNHTSAIMNGKARTDVTIGSTTLSSVQSQYNSARSAHPNDVIVLHLTGTTYTGDATVTLSSNTCVILTGTINLNSGIRAFNASSASFVSISGGVINGNNTTGRNGINFSSCTMVMVDRVTLQNFGAKATRVGGSDVIHLSGGGSPQIVGYSTINGGAARGIWSQLSGQKSIFSDNDCSNVNMDGIDCDSHTNSSLVKVNNCHDNVRYGVFIEQGAKYNQALANTCTSNGRGLNIYDNLADTTNWNTAAFNRCDLNGTGIRVGSFDSTTEASHNFLFNNVITNSTSGGVNSETTGTQNYWSQQSLSGNGSDYGSTASAVFFNSKDVP